MKLVIPRAIHIAQTGLDEAGLIEYLDAIGAPTWETDAHSEAEELIEVLGRMCYRSFAPGLNPNVTKVREGNADYLANIEGHRHGSLFENATDTYILFDVSRIVTHQLVRHRAGTAWAQESGHYVRVEGIKSWMPPVIADNAEAAALYVETMERLEQVQLDLARILAVDTLSFHEKKRATTAMRRLVPDGIATAIAMTGNHRAWRWTIQLRTERSNDEEIRLVMAEVFKQQVERYPALYGDAVAEEVEGFLEVRFENEKI
jgi:thymidylate synthase (FAD)